MSAKTGLKKPIGIPVAMAVTSPNVRHSPAGALAAGSNQDSRKLVLAPAARSGEGSLTLPMLAHPGLSCRRETRLLKWRRCPMLVPRCLFLSGVGCSIERVFGRGWL